MTNDKHDAIPPISHIRNSLLRRTLIIVTFPMALVCAIVLGVCWGIYEHMRLLGDAIHHAWGGEP